MPWNPELYHRFQPERFAPFTDLLMMVQVREVSVLLTWAAAQGN